MDEALGLQLLKSRQFNDLTVKVISIRYGKLRESFTFGVNKTILLLNNTYFASLIDEMVEGSTELVVETHDDLTFHGIAMMLLYSYTATPSLSTVYDMWPEFQKLEDTMFCSSEDKECFEAMAPAKISGRRQMSVLMEFYKATETLDKDGHPMSRMRKAAGKLYCEGVNTFVDIDRVEDLADILADAFRLVDLDDTELGEPLTRLCIQEKEFFDRPECVAAKRSLPWVQYSAGLDLVSGNEVVDEMMLEQYIKTMRTLFKYRYELLGKTPRQAQRARAGLGDESDAESITSTTSDAQSSY